MRKVALVLALAFSFQIRGVRAENWPRWRGPNGQAISSDTTLPLHWGVDHNVRWKAAVPGEGFSSPIVWGDRLFVTSAFDRGRRRVTHCFRTSDGRVQWSAEIADDNPEVSSAMTGHAASTPATDGERVVAWFGNAGLVCYDLDGNQLWQRDFGDFESELGLASSPILHGDRVFLVCDHDGKATRTFDSFLIAVDIRSGKTMWRVDRPGLFRSWSTPILVPAADRQVELIVNAQDQLRAYDPDNGTQHWHVEGMAGWVTPSPVFGHGLVFATSGRDGPTLAVRPSGRGNVTASHVVWQHRQASPYVCSPVLYGDYLYVHTDRGILSCYRAMDGELAYRERLDGRFVASSVAADGKVFIADESGTTHVIRAGPRFEVLARNALNEYTLASPAIADGSLYARTERHLYRIAAEPAR